MRSVFLILLLFYSINGSLWSKPIDEDLKQYAKEVADKLRGAIWNEWDVSVNGTTVRVESKFDIYCIHLIGGLGEIPTIPNANLSNIHTEDLEKYFIELKIEESLPRDELIKRAHARQQAADILNFGEGPEEKAKRKDQLDRFNEQIELLRKNKNQFTDKEYKDRIKALKLEHILNSTERPPDQIYDNIYSTIRAPRYLFKDSFIYRKLHHSDLGGVQTFPEKAARKIGAVKGIIDQVLTPLRAWND